MIIRCRLMRSGRVKQTSESTAAPQRPSEGIRVATLRMHGVVLYHYRVRTVLDGVFRFVYTFRGPLNLTVI